MKQYLDLMRHVRSNGVFKEDRTGTGTYSVFGYQMRFDLSGGQFPLVTTKKCHLKSIIHELLWFLQGDTNIRYLKENGVRIWDEWADENGELGPVYGAQWRSWPTPVKCETCGGTGKCNDADFGDVSFNEWTCPKCKGRGNEGIDQITNLIDMLKKNPDSRRLIVSAWNPALVDQMALPPCHALFQFYSVKLTRQEREKILQPGYDGHNSEYSNWLCELDDNIKGEALGQMIDQYLDDQGVPKRRLSCQLYQRKVKCALVA